MLESKFSFLNPKVIAIVALIFVCACAGYARDSPAVLISNKEHCISSEYLADWMGLNLKKQKGSESINLSRGKKKLTLNSCSIVATLGNKSTLLQTCPILRDSVFYVPTKSIVRAFGGKATDTADGLMLDFIGKSIVVPYPVTNEPASPIDRLNEDILDPRISLSSLVKTSATSSRLWTYLNDFNAAASQVQPVLKAISSNPALIFLSRVPVVGAPVSITQYTAHCLNASIQASEFLGKLHGQSDVPIKKAAKAAEEFSRDPSADNAKAGVTSWSAAATAVDKNLVQAKRTITLTQKMIDSITTVEDKVGERLGKKAASKHVLGLSSFNRAANQYLLRLQGSKWEQESLKSYFNRLANDAAKL